MALINCPECGKEVSDKARNCPSCGYPLITSEEQPSVAQTSNSTEEEYLCCPKCMSRELHAEKAGYSGGKAAAGLVLVGGVGLLAGTIGSRDIKITCLKCGHQCKAGEAKIVKQGKALDALERRIIYLLCEGDTVGASRLYQQETHCSDEECHRKIMRLIDEVPKYITPEQQEKQRKYYQDIKAGKGGCLGIVVIMVALSAFLLML